MNLGIIGYGKMGAEIEKISIQKGYSIKFKINSKNTHELTSNALSKVDVVFEFSNPNTAFNNVLLCLKNKKPIVCGTTGWMKNLPEAKKVSFETSGNLDEDHDELLEAAARLIIDTGQASVSLLQRKFRIGYSRAGRLIDELEALGIISGYSGSKARDVLVDYSYLDES